MESHDEVRGSASNVRHPAENHQGICHIRGQNTQNQKRARGKGHDHQISNTKKSWVTVMQDPNSESKKKRLNIHSSC